MLSRRRFGPLIIYGSGPAACCVGLLLVAIASDVVSRPGAQWAPWLVGLPLVGIPHGALDHRCGASVEPSGPRARCRFLAVYLGLMMMVLAAWWWAPFVALCGFLLLAAFHFGQGDLYWSQVIRGGCQRESLVEGHRARIPRQRSRPRRALFLLVRGLVPITLPFFAQAELLRITNEDLLGRLFQSKASWSLPQEAELVCLWIMGLFIGLELCLAVLEAIRSRGGARLAALAEATGTSLLVLWFSVAPPVLAMGVYFHAWHSLRHIGRLLPMTDFTREAAARGRWVDAFARFEQAALPTTLVALAFLIAFGWLVHERMRSVTDLGLIALAFIAALTLPHVLVVLRLDQRQAIWFHVGKPPR